MRERSTTVSKAILYIPLVLITLFFALGFVLSDFYLGTQEAKRVQRHLQSMASGGANLLEFALASHGTILDFDQFADTHASAERFRVTIVADSGEVLGDSELSQQKISTLENHGDRPEFRDAEQQGVGFASRHSNTLATDLLYVAVPFRAKQLNGYFRIALPKNLLQQERYHQRMTLLTITGIVFILAIATSLFTSRYFILVMTRARKNLEQKIEKRTHEVDILHNLSTQLTTCNSIAEALDVLQVVSSRLLPRFSGTIALFQSSQNSLEIVQTWQGDWQGAMRYSPDQCWALRTGQIHLGDGNSGNMPCPHCQGSELVTLCLPLVAQGVTHGVLHFSHSPPAHWTQEERQLALAVAEHVSLALANLELRDNLRQQAIKDQLTGLYNRRYLIETLEHELSRAARRHQPLGILMLDLDHFKRFNDQHGHDAGDFILHEFGNLLRLTLRSEDIACRYGGEEFTVLLPETDADGTRQTAEKIVTQMRNHDFIQGNRSFGPITVSVGVALYPDHGRNIDQLLKQADDALYLAKQKGRDRIVFHHQKEII